LAFDVAAEKWTDYNTFSGNIATSSMSVQMPVYLRIVATSTSNIAYYFSRGGLVWVLLSAAYNPGITLVNVGVCVGPQNASFAGEAFFDWVRFQ
jgi:hypothetical protein